MGVVSLLRGLVLLYVVVTNEKLLQPSTLYHVSIQLGYIREWVLYLWV